MAASSVLATGAQAPLILNTHNPLCGKCTKKVCTHLFRSGKHTATTRQSQQMSHLVGQAKPTLLQQTFLTLLRQCGTLKFKKLLLAHSCCLATPLIHLSPFRSTWIQAVLSLPSISTATQKWLMLFNSRMASTGNARTRLVKQILLIILLPWSHLISGRPASQTIAAHGGMPHHQSTWLLATPSTKWC